MTDSARGRISPTLRCMSWASSYAVQSPRPSRPSTEYPVAVTRMVLDRELMTRHTTPKRSSTPDRRRRGEHDHGDGGTDERQGPGGALQRPAGRPASAQPGADRGGVGGAEPVRGVDGQGRL